MYESEWEVRDHYDEYVTDHFLKDPGPHRERMRKDAQRFVDKTLKRKYIQRHYDTRPIIVRGRSAHRFAQAWQESGVIDLPWCGEWGWGKMIILHEMAHILEYRMYGNENQPHGWQFCAIFLDLVRNVLGKEAAEALKAEFKENKVRFRPKRTRTMTPEQRVACGERLKQARLAKQKQLC